MTKRLYVGSLPHHVTKKTLESLFSAYGTVESATLMINKITDLSDGFGFVTMSCESEAQAAIHNLDSTEVEGCIIKVHEARPRPVLPRRKSIRRHRW
jgi:RNA recognition motif-containing protein